MNPFDMVFAALWDLAEDSVPLTDLVKPGNRIKFHDEDQRDPIKQIIGDSDTPELVLLSDGTSKINIHNTSSSSMICRRYSWLVATGDFRLAERLHPVDWALFCAMCDWKNVLSVLEWNSKRFVKRCDVLDVSVGYSDPERNRGIKGWSARWQCEVEMHFTTAELKEFNIGGS